MLQAEDSAGGTMEQGRHPSIFFRHVGWHMEHQKKKSII